MKLNRSRPPWLDSERFDVIAKAPENQPLTPPSPGGPPSTIQRMVQSLLAERFSFAAHSETREMPVYHLVTARDDRRLGPRIRPSTDDCSTPPSAVPSALRPQCGIRLSLGELSAVGRTLNELGGILSQFVQRPVENQTGLSGAFEFELAWTPDPSPNVPVERIPPIDPDRPTLYTALQEQLGLRLQATRSPLAALVIDRAVKPNPD